MALAAPQIGRPLRVIVVDVSRDRKAERRSGHGLTVLINPKILLAEDFKVVREGCLSIPQFTANVLRAQRVVVTGRDPEGRVRVLESSGYEAVAFQHEIDHLNGRLFLDRIASLRRDLFPRRGGQA